MLEPPHIFDERATTYATGTNCSNILTDEMHGLYLFSFLLSADLDKAEQCFVSELGECKEEIGVFMAWAQAWARRTILRRAIRIIMPAPQRADDFSFALLKGSAPSGRTNLFDAIVALNAFECFVYVMSVLEGQSDDDCSALLRCSRRDVIIARAGTRTSGKHSQSLRSSRWGRGGHANNGRESLRLTYKSSSVKASGSQSDALRSPEELRQSDR